MTVLHLTALAAGRALAAGGVAKSGEAAKSGPIGFAVILVLCVACYFLFKSMSRHLRKVREEFPADERSAAPEAKPAANAPSAVTGPPPTLPATRSTDAPKAADPSTALPTAPERTPEA